MPGLGVTPVGLSALLFLAARGVRGWSAASLACAALAQNAFDKLHPEKMTSMQLLWMSRAGE